MLQSFKLALKSIWSNKVRSALTMFGIIIGVASVIILVSLMNGYLNSQISQWGDLGATNINVSRAARSRWKRCMPISPTTGICLPA